MYELTAHAKDASTREPSRFAIIAFLPALAALMTWSAEPWVVMIAMTLAIYAAAKSATLAVHRCDCGWGQVFGYLLAWPGMDAGAFFRRTCHLASPSLGDWLRGFAHIATGAALVWLLVPQLMSVSALIAGWVGFVGLLHIVHFGLFDLAASVWRTVGVDTQPIMRWPLASTSLGEFWGKRWNRAFRDLVHPLIFQPLLRRLGPSGGLLAAFGVSGLIHELAVSLPARGGFGGPTAYFLLQGAAMLAEHSALGKAAGLGKGWRGWCFTMLAVLGPAVLLFHPPFIRQVIVPFLGVIGAN